MAQDDTQKLYEQGLAAVEVGDKQAAIDLFMQVVEADETNLDAWVELSKVLNDPNEKRIALTTILQLDPGNNYAKAALQATERKPGALALDNEIAPGITRRLLRTVILIAAVYTLVVCGLAFAIGSTISGQQQAAAREIAQLNAGVTQTQQAIINAQETVIAEQTAEAEAATATAFAISSPTPTITPTPDFPTAIPPTPTATEITLRVLEPPPSTISGTIVATGGRSVLGSGFRNLYQFPVVARTEGVRLERDIAQAPTVDKDGTRLVFMRFIPASNAWTLHSIDPRNPESPGIDLNAIWQNVGLVDAAEPRLSADGRYMVFVAPPVGATNNQVYLVNIEARTAVRITNDGDNYASVAISPDATRVVAIRETSGSADLVLIDSSSGSFRQDLLTNNGGTLLESSPAFSADGTQIVFSAANISTPDDNDLYIIRLVGTSGTPIPIVSTTANEIHPIFSPDGQYVAYSANPAGFSNIFIFELATSTTYQLNAGEEDFFVGGWWQ